MAGKRGKSGGKRPGSGRKRDPAKDIKAGAAVALKVLAEIQHEQQLIRIYRNSGHDPDLQSRIIFRLMEWGYGKPMQPNENSVAFNKDQPLRVVIEHIGA